MIILMLGAPGAGKGTTSKVLSEALNIPHISTGDIIRDIIKSNNEESKLLSSYIDEGKLVPDDVIEKIIEERVSEDDCKNGFVFDGFPRNKNQIIICNHVLEKIGKQVDLVLNLDVSNETIIKRLENRRICLNCKSIYNLRNPSMTPKVAGLCDKCGHELIQRSDDKKEKVEFRIKVYEKETKPIIAYYEKTGKLVNLDIKEDESVEQTVENILHYIGKKGKNDNN